MPHFDLTVLLGQLDVLSLQIPFQVGPTPSEFKVFPDGGSLLVECEPLVGSGAGPLGGVLLGQHDDLTVVPRLRTVGNGG